MITLGRCNQLLDHGFSIITVGENKIPNFPWKPSQTKQLSKEEFQKRYDYKGGIIKQDGTELTPTNAVGIVTGFEGLEVIDVDLKVFSSLTDQNNFWDEYLSFLKDNIDDFDLKFVIYKTKNHGYHIIYKCKKIDGNKKIAKLKGQTEAIIESRGIGGYVFIYENQISKLSYTDIVEISENDREILWSISKTYNYVEDIQPEKIEVKEFNEATIKCWDDYNSKVSIFDIISPEIKIIRTLNDKYIVKRDGATSPHSGYVYKNSGCMYLFSTGTCYPNEKLISPFAAYTFKNHHGDFKSAASALYKDGFGTRIVKEPEIKELPKINKDELIFPIDIFPKPIQSYMIECNQTLDSSIDYMGCSMLWLLSVVIGNSIQVEVKRGWNETATIWMAVVGKAGLGKTPSINNIVYPLIKANNKEIKNFIKQTEKYDYYNNLDKKEKSNTEEVRKPVKTQFIANDITIEALVDLHQENKNSIGVFKDELAGWFKDMNKYREGSDLEFWLSTWSGKAVNLNRKTAKSSFVDKPLIPVLGGIQPSILNSFYTDDNKDNGFVDRMLLSFPDLEIDKYNDKEMDYSTIMWYSDAMISFYETIRHKVIEYDEDGDIKPKTAKFSPKAKKEWIRIFNDITNVQNSDDENEYMKSMLPKQKSYIPRFALLIHTMESFFDDSKSIDALIISDESMKKAEKVSKYFIAMAKKIKVNSIEKTDIKIVLKQLSGKTNKEKLSEIYKLNPDFNRSETAEILGISRQMVLKYMKDLVTTTDNQVTTLKKA